MPANSAFVEDLEAFIEKRRARRLTRVREIDQAETDTQKLNTALNAMLEAYETDVDLAQLLRRHLAD